MPKIIIFDALTNEVTEREMTDDEIAALTPTISPNDAEEATPE